MASKEIIRSTIYVLLDANNLPRYVGQTRLTLAERLRRHVNVARKPSETSHRCNWIRKCLSEGHTPVIEAWQEVEGTQKDVDDAERKWIDILKNVMGLKLTNSQMGGEGMSMTDETKQKISRGNKGKVRSPEMRARWSAAHKGKVISVETRQKISDANRGRKLWSAEDRATKLKAAWDLRRQRYGPTGSN